MQLARAVVEAMSRYKVAQLRALDWQTYLSRRPATLR
jgi:hypothetical protein